MFDAKVSETSSIVESIVEKPPGPGFFRQCSECKKFFALQSIGRDHQPSGHTVEEYKCRFCGAIERFSSSHPDQVL